MRYEENLNDVYNKYEPDLYHTDIVMGMGDVFDYAVDICDYNLADFTNKFLASKTFDEFLRNDSLNCQSPLYVIDEFLRLSGVEVKKLESNEKKLSKYESLKTAYWLGNILCTWGIVDEISGKDILKKYDIEMIIIDYERLHVTSMSLAIDQIKKEYTREYVKKLQKEHGWDFEKIKEDLF